MPHGDCTECNFFTAGKIKSDLKFKEAFFFPKKTSKEGKSYIYIYYLKHVCVCLLLQLKKTFFETECFRD